MNNTLKYILVAVIALLSIALITDRFLHEPTTAVQTPSPETTVGPFEGLPLRFNGYYRNQIGDLLYLIRFFPEGRVVLVNGNKQGEADLPKFLIRETQGNPSIGLYNVMPEVRGDSIYFVTRPEKGEISYRGKVMNGSLVRFHRHSHITGVSHDMEYILSLIHISEPTRPY